MAFEIMNIFKMTRFCFEKTTLLPRIQAHPLIGAPVPNPNKGACA